jgi:hypothetical protein
MLLAGGGGVVVVVVNELVVVVVVVVVAASGNGGGLLAAGTAGCWAAVAAYCCHCWLLAGCGRVLGRCAMVYGGQWERW